MSANLVGMESEDPIAKLLLRVRRRIRQVQGDGGEGEVVIVLRLERPPVIKVMTIDREAA